MPALLQAGKLAEAETVIDDAIRQANQLAHTCQV
jgi:hypothetical protein